MRLLGLAISAVALAFATAAAAQPAPATTTQDDARCLLAMVGLTNTDDQNAQHFGADGVVFFTGRLTAREPNFDFTRLRSMAQTLDPKTVQADLQQRCAPMLQNSMQKVETALAPPAGSTPPSAPSAPLPAR
jgi:hypothetical protein